MPLLTVKVLVVDLQLNDNRTVLSISTDEKHQLFCPTFLEEPTTFSLKLKKLKTILSNSQVIFSNQLPTSRFIETPTRISLQCMLHIKGALSRLKCRILYVVHEHWPVACYNYTVLSCNRKRIMSKVVEPKKYQLRGTND